MDTFFLTILLNIHHLYNKLISTKINVNTNGPKHFVNLRHSGDKTRGDKWAATSAPLHVYTALRAKVKTNLHLLTRKINAQGEILLTRSFHCVNARTYELLKSISLTPWTYSTSETAYSSYDQIKRQKKIFVIISSLAEDERRGKKTSEETKLSKKGNSETQERTWKREETGTNYGQTADVKRGKLKN